MDKIVLFGDSLTQEGFSVGGWAALLANRYVRRVDVLNRGYSGYNTRWALELNDQLKCGNEGRIVLATVLFGANDASSGKQHVPLEEYEANLEAIVKNLKDLKSENIVVISPPPVDAEQYYNEFLLPATSWNGVAVEDIVVDRKTEFVEPYAEACKRVAEKLKVVYFDLFHLLLNTAESEKKMLSFYMRDGLHFNQSGNEVLFNGLMNCVEKNIPEIYNTPSPANNNPANSTSICPSIEPKAPWWDKIDVQAEKGQFLADFFKEEEPSAKRQKTDDAEN